MDFYHLRRESGLDSVGCSELLKVSLRTVKNWDSGAVRAPQAAMLCLQYRSGGLAVFGSKWRNFRVMDNVIIDDCKNFVYPHEIRFMRYLYLSAGIARYQLAKVELVSPTGSILKTGFLGKDQVSSIEKYCDRSNFSCIE